MIEQKGKIKEDRNKLKKECREGKLKLDKQLGEVKVKQEATEKSQHATLLQEIE